MALSSLDDSSSRVILGLMIPGICLTTVLLILYAYAAWNPISRRYLDRVSFRLLVYALLAHLVYGTFFVVGALAASSGWRCGLFAFVTNLSLMFSAGMFFCMALNLPLVLAYHVNGQKMEKYYILGTAFICLVCNLPPYASGNLGLYAVDGSETCWYRGPNRASIRGWLIGTQTFWMLLASTGEVTSFFIIVGYLIVHELDTRYFRTDSRLNASCDSSVLRPPGSTIRRFRNIILRIGLYPLVSCLINISASVLDLYVMMHPQAPLTWRLNIGDLAIYAARPLIYGLLAATDPSFLRAFRALRHPDSEGLVKVTPLTPSAAFCRPS
ncbi:hypothetical protein DFH06DRAFT_1060860 [Mycena polygramma]|nr:hypothetical protein DFH06DRAFT_1060860 [Mycena polygramma]